MQLFCQEWQELFLSYDWFYVNHYKAVLYILDSKNKVEVPIWEKQNLTIKEAAAYSGIGEHTLRSLVKQKGCTFALCVGSKHMIKRKLFDKYIEKARYL